MKTKSGKIADALDPTVTRNISGRESNEIDATKSYEIPPGTEEFILERTDDDATDQGSQSNDDSAQPASMSPLDVDPQEI